MIVGTIPEQSTSALASRPQPSRAATPSTMSEPVEAITTTSGRPPARAASAPISTIAAFVDDSGTPRNPDAVSPPSSTHTTGRSPATPGRWRTSTRTGAVVPRRRPRTDMAGTLTGGRQAASGSASVRSCHSRRAAATRSRVANRMFERSSLILSARIPPIAAVTIPAAPMIAGGAQVGVALRAVAPRAHHRGRDDHRRRRPLGDDGRDAEEQDHRRHHDDPPAHAEQPGEDARRQADDDERRGSGRRDRGSTVGVGGDEQPDGGDDEQPGEQQSRGCGGGGRAGAWCR